MEKFFNCSGPCVPSKHYMVEVRSQFQKLQNLVDQERYFIMHAPRQTGKTTVVNQFVKHLNEQGHYIALYTNVEAGQALRNQVEKVNNLIVAELEQSAMVSLPKEYQPSEACFEIHSIEIGMSTFLSKWCLELPKPLVLFIDEIDALIGDSLISVLRQLRQGYTQHPRSFPQALCLIGLRDIRDYRIYSDETKRYVIGGSAFNIKEKSVRIQDFTLDQVRNLYEQHTEATGQTFTPEAVPYLFEQTNGQPWLINALGRELCFEEDAIPRDQTVTKDHVDEAIERLILRRDVHLDQLADKLTEPRVARVIEGILIGTETEEASQIPWEDKQYLVDLGLLRKGIHGDEIANPIYREIVPRELTSVRQDRLGQNPAWYILETGKLDIYKVIGRYIEFYKEHSELITARKTYTEAAHHLLSMSWLQRIVNGGGYIRREYAAGLGRLDLCIEFSGERFAFELKLNSRHVLKKGRQQLADYLHRLSLPSGWLMVFSRGEVTDWDQVGRREHLTEAGKQIEVIWL